MVREPAHFGDILLVEDIAETVEGLELDLRARGGAVTRVPDGVRARQALRNEEWSIILFDLRLPENEGDEPTLAVGLQLIEDKQRGALGALNQATPYCMITLQSTVSEADEFMSTPECLGFFSKNEDSRRLFRTLRGYGLLKDHFFDDVEDQEVRRRVKFAVISRDPDRGTVTLEAPTWGAGQVEIGLSNFRPGIRQRLLDGGLPVFVYGTANVAADTAFGLSPAEFDEVAEVVPPLRLHEKLSGDGQDA